MEVFVPLNANAEVRDVGEELLLGVAAHVRERKYRDRLLSLDRFCCWNLFIGIHCGDLFGDHFHGIRFRFQYEFIHCEVNNGEHQQPDDREIEFTSGLAGDGLR